MSRTEILSQALEAREAEVFHYQINIDNYTLAIAEIEGLSEEEQGELATFKEQLCGLLESEKLEQKKAKIMLAVIKTQLEA